MTVVGIDPGKEGGIAVIAGGRAVFAEPMPLIAEEIDVKRFLDIVQSHEANLVMFEKPATPPGKGSVSSALKQGVNFGMLLGACEVLNVPYQLVHPSRWKTRVFGASKGDKNVAINHVRKKYPSVDLTPGRKVKPHDGIADAVCIAEYGVKEAGNE